MCECFEMLKNNFSDIGIKYYTSLGILVIKCKNVACQLESMKKILKTLIFEIQSKHIQKDVINIEITDKDFLDNNVEKLLNIMKFTKTSHYFNIIIKATDVLENEINSRINYITNKFVGLNINKEINLNKGENNERVQDNRF